VAALISTPNIVTILYSKKLDAIVLNRAITPISFELYPRSFITSKSSPENLQLSS
jgi:hypothetical protein